MKLTVNGSYAPRNVVRRSNRMPARSVDKTQASEDAIGAGVCLALNASPAMIAIELNLHFLRARRARLS